jgi:uncharacterized protein YjiK
MNKFGNKIFIIFLISILSYSCSKSDEFKTDIKILKQIESYSLDIKEPSDLCFGSSTGTLYTVSDNTCKVYKITTTGKIIAELNYTGQDLEGVTFVDNQNLYIAEERFRQIVKLDLQGNELMRRDIPVEINDINSGLEGISYSTFNNHFYILNEKTPGVLIETDQNLNVLDTYTLSFANDYSGICVDNKNNELWIVSDESASVFRCTLKGVVIESYSIAVYNAEGIAVDSENKKIYIVSDSRAKLYIFNYQ